MIKRLLTAAVAAAITLTCSSAIAEYPDKPVRIVFPNKAGSGYHKIILALVEELKSNIPHTIAVQAMPGAGTSAGTRFVQEQADDGYTLLFIHEAAFQTSAFGMLGFDILEEFQPLVRTNSNIPSLVTRGDAPFSNIAELRKYAGTNPVKAAINTGALSHLEFIGLSDTLGIDLRLVHVGGGGAGFKQAVLAGDVDLIHTNAGSVRGLVDAGQLKMLSYYGGGERHVMFPDIPTLEEQGFDTPGTVGNNGYLWIRRSAPQEAKDYWINILEAVLTNPESESKLEEILGVDMGYLSGDDLEKLARELYDQRAGYIKEFGISVNK